MGLEHRLAKELIGPPAGSSLRIGVERDLLTMHVAEALRETFPGCELIDVGPAIFEARLIKSEEEISVLRLGRQIAKIGASAFMEAQHEGATEIAVAAHAVAEMEAALGALAPELLSSTYAYCQAVRAATAEGLPRPALIFEFRRNRRIANRSLAAELLDPRRRLASARAHR